MKAQKEWKVLYMINVDKKQQKKLDEFYKEETTWFPEHVVNNFVMCLFVGISIILLVIPTAALDGKNDIKAFVVIPWLLYNTGILTYLSKFTIYRDKINQSKSIYELIKYLPISYKQIVLYKQKKLLARFFIINVIIIVLKNVISIAVYRKISIFDIVIPIALGLIFPMVVISLEFLIQKM